MTYQLSADKFNLFAALKVFNHGRHGNGEGETPIYPRLRAGPCGTTLATAFGSDLRSVDTLRSSLRSPNPMPSARAHQRYAYEYTQVKNVPHRILIAIVYHRIHINAVVTSHLITVANHSHDKTAK